MRNKFIFSLLFLIAVILATSCSYTSIEFKSIDEVSFDSEKGKGQFVKAKITFYNPNSKNFTIENIDIDVYLKNAYLGKLVVEDAIVIKKRSEFESNVKVYIDKNNLLVAGAALLGSFGKKELELSFKGEMHIKHRFFNKQVPVNFTEKVKI